MKHGWWSPEIPVPIAAGELKTLEFRRIYKNSRVMHFCLWFPEKGFCVLWETESEESMLEVFFLPFFEYVWAGTTLRLFCLHATQLLFGHLQIFLLFGNVWSPGRWIFCFTYRLEYFSPVDCRRLISSWLTFKPIRIYSLSIASKYSSLSSAWSEWGHLRNRVFGNTCWRTRYLCACAGVGRFHDKFKEDLIIF